MLSATLVDSMSVTGTTARVSINMTDQETDQLMTNMRVMTPKSLVMLCSLSAVRLVIFSQSERITQRNQC